MRTQSDSLFSSLSFTSCRIAASICSCTSVTPSADCTALHHHRALIAHLGRLRVLLHLPHHLDRDDDVALLVEALEHAAECAEPSFPDDLVYRQELQRHILRLQVPSDCRSLPRDTYSERRCSLLVCRRSCRPCRRAPSCRRCRPSPRAARAPARALPSGCARAASAVSSTCTRARCGCVRALPARGRLVRGSCRARVRSSEVWRCR